MDEPCHLGISRPTRQFAPQDKYTLNIVLIILNGCDARRGLLHGGKVRKRSYAIEHFLLGLCKLSLAREHRLGYASIARQSGIGQTEHVVPVKTSHRNTAKLISE